LLSLICSWHFSHRGTETGDACLSSHLKLQTCPGNIEGLCQAPFTALLRKCERLQIAARQKGLAWKAVAQPHLPMALLAQSRRDWGCLLVFQPQTSNVSWEWRGSLLGSFRSPAPKMRKSVDSWQPEGASLESCCSASSAHSTSHREAQRLGLLACLPTSNFKPKMVTGESLPGSFHSPAPKMRMSADSWQPEGASLESCCSASSARGTARTEMQRLGLLACLPTSNFKRILGMAVVSARLLSQPCSKNEIICR